MAWTAPRTWVTGETVTAALMNTHVRDNLLETCPATVTTAGDLVYADAANSMGSRLAIGSSGSVLVSNGSAPVWREVQEAFSSSAEAVTNTAYTGWATPLRLSSVATGTRALVYIGCKVENSTGGTLNYISYDISGATTSASADVRGAFYEPSAANDRSSIGRLDWQSLTSGNNTFEMEARVTSGTGTFTHGTLILIPLS